MELGSVDFDIVTKRNIEVSIDPALYIVSQSGTGLSSIRKFMSNCTYLHIILSFKDKHDLRQQIYSPGGKELFAHLPRILFFFLKYKLWT